MHAGRGSFYSPGSPAHFFKDWTKAVSHTTYEVTIGDQTITGSQTFDTLSEALAEFNKLEQQLHEGSILTLEVERISDEEYNERMRDDG